MTDHFRIKGCEVHSFVRSGLVEAVKNGNLTARLDGRAVRSKVSISFAYDHFIATQQSNSVSVSGAVYLYNPIVPNP